MPADWYNIPSAETGDGQRVIRSSGELNDQLFERIWYKHQPEQSMNWFVPGSWIQCSRLDTHRCSLLPVHGRWRHSDMANCSTRRSQSHSDALCSPAYTRSGRNSPDPKKISLKINSCFPWKSNFLLMLKSLLEFSLFICKRFTILY